MGPGQMIEGTDGTRTDDRGNRRDTRTDDRGNRWDQDR